MAKVLISDKMHPLAEEIFKKKGVEVDVKTGLSPEDLKEIIGEYDGLAIRSSTKATQEILNHAKNLKIIGRAGIGVDNIDIPAATNAGIIVVNTPFGNSITTAEHAIAMMFSLARQIPQANVSTHAGKWEKSKFMGTEVFAKTLGVIGCGNIGSIVASRGLGLQMDVIAFDPFLTDERAAEMGVKKVEIDELFEKSDFITIHVPKNDKTINLINKDSISKMKKGAYIINCARGGIVNEQDLKEALDNEQIAGAALDVFEIEPAKENILFGHEKVICTPHLGASTTEAQINVAIQVAEQLSDYLNSGSVVNSLNMPSISAEEAPKLKPYMKMAEQIGGFAGQITEHAIKNIEIEYQGAASNIKTTPITSMIISSILTPIFDNVNIVNSSQIAKNHGIKISETKTEECTSFNTAITVKIETDERTRTLTATLFANDEPRIVEIENVAIEAALSPNMLFIRNDDTPGLIGNIGSILGNAGKNIADFRLGRISNQGDALALVSLDDELPDELFENIANLPQVKIAKKLKF